MNRFIKYYQTEIDEGSNSLEALGYTFLVLAPSGNMNDVEEVYDYFLKSMMEKRKTEYARAKLTSYERKMKEAGHKEGDFL